MSSGQDWVKSVPFIYKVGPQLTIEDLSIILQTPKGMVLKYNDYNMPLTTLPPTAELLKLFEKINKRPLVDGDSFHFRATVFDSLCELAAGDENTVFQIRDYHIGQYLRPFNVFTVYDNVTKIKIGGTGDFNLFGN